MKEHRIIIDTTQFTENDSDEFRSDCILKAIAFEELCVRCAYDITNFTQIIGDMISNKVPFVQSDFGIKRFVSDMCLIPFNYEEMTIDEIAFLHDLTSRYLVTPMRHDNIHELIKEQRQAKYN